MRNNSATLRCERNCKSVKKEILKDFRREGLMKQHPGSSPVFEHGCYWMVCQCGASWGVADAVIHGEECFAFEQVSYGDEEYHK
jgi:hypothetical protein